MINEERQSERKTAKGRTSRLSRQDVFIIHRLRREGWLLKQIAPVFGMSSSYICKVINHGLKSRSVK
jgi:AraC-like DNA-binding protein